jgi:hypothetical protein
MNNSTNCPVSDDKLLLLAHNELSVTESWSVKRHVKSCAKCRLILGDYTAASAAIASVVRDSSAPRWHFKSSAPGHALNLGSALTAVAATAAIAVAIGAVVMEYKFYNPTYSMSAGSRIEGHHHFCHDLPTAAGYRHHHHRTTPPM